MRMLAGRAGLLLELGVRSQLIINDSPPWQWGVGGKGVGSKGGAILPQRARRGFAGQSPPKPHPFHKSLWFLLFIFLFLFFFFYFLSFKANRNKRLPQDKRC